MNEIHQYLQSNSSISISTSRQDIDDGNKTTQQNEESFNNEVQKDSRQRGYKSRPFSQLEDDLILHLVETYGPKFKKFLKFFRGRDYNNLKNRYYKYLKCQEGQQDKLRSEVTNIKKNKQNVKASSSKKKIKIFEKQMESLNKNLLKIDIEEDIQFLMFNFMNNMFSLFNDIS